MYRRVSVVGTSGVGKSTFARALAERLDVPHIELDELHWGPDWTAAPAPEFRAVVRARLDGPEWVIDGNYQSKLGRMVWEHADTVVWLDPPRWLTMWRLTRRTAGRVFGRQTLWNGNRESLAVFKIWKGEESVLWWSWVTFARNRERYLSAMSDPALDGLAFHRLRTRRDVGAFLKQAG
ncbi:Hypothetical protein BJL86_2077 [Dietzia timorensis]|uniref:Adenylate kinase n=1 Tax=Dietzia timorensis TaxID=499555 RepID=A0A173LME5_9ACTN|nr:Hypothetical protein BJL86_2077 [Dietzia timorensis]